MSAVCSSMFDVKELSFKHVTGTLFTPCSTRRWALRGFSQAAAKAEARRAAEKLEEATCHRTSSNHGTMGPWAELGFINFGCWKMSGVLFIRFGGRGNMVGWLYCLDAFEGVKLYMSLRCAFWSWERGASLANWKGA